MGVFAFPSKELFVRADFGDFPLIHDDDAVCIPNRGKPMRHDKRGSSLHQRLEGLLNVALALGIQSTRRFVKKQDLGVLEKGTGDGDALTLTSAQTVGERCDPIGERRSFRSTLDLFARYLVFATVGDVPRNRVVEDDDLLTHKRDLGAQ